MNMNRIVFASALIAAASVLAAEQIEIPDWENSVQFRLVTSQEPVRPGDSFSVALVAEIEEGYHLYGPEEPYPTGTVVSVSGEGLEVGEALYPPVETRELSGLGTYDLFEGTIAIRIPVKLSDSAMAGEHLVKATVDYQVCTDFACSAPTSDELALSVFGGAVGAAIEHLHPEIFKSK